MPELVAYCLTAVVSVFFIVNPLGNTPIFLALTEGMERDERIQVVKRACIVVVAVLTLFALGGNLVLQTFHITLHAIRIAGGVILFFIASSMIQAERLKMKSRPEEESEARAKEDISIVPLAVPMLAGPGAITTVLVMVGNGDHWWHTLIVLAAIVITGLLTFFTLSFGARLLSFLGKTGINIFTRLMGLLLAALAVQFILNGIGGALPDLLQHLNH